MGISVLTTVTWIASVSAESASNCLKKEGTITANETKYWDSFPVMKLPPKNCLCDFYNEEISDGVKRPENVTN
jgi:hypothetical protein